MSSARKRTVLVTALAAGVLGTLMLTQAAFAGYNRPVSATPFNATFVPAMKQCGGAAPNLIGTKVPNGLHGAPLAFASCYNNTATNTGPGPERRSRYLTTGTPGGEGGDGGTAKMVASIKLALTNTGLATEDITVTTPNSGPNGVLGQGISDVRCVVGGGPGQTYVCPANAGAGGTKGDYPTYLGGATPGTLMAQATIRITDLYNGPASPVYPAPCGNPPAGGAACTVPAAGTVVDIPFTIPLRCRATDGGVGGLPADTSVGSLCTPLAPTVDTLFCGSPGCTPGDVVKTGMRGMVEIGTGTDLSTAAGNPPDYATEGSGGAIVRDGGPNGSVLPSPAGNDGDVFLRQGIFLP